MKVGGGAQEGLEPIRTRPQVTSGPEHRGGGILKESGVWDELYSGRLGRL